MKDNERQTEDGEERAEMHRNKKRKKERRSERDRERESKASETKGESLNLSSSPGVQNERRIAGWIIGAKPQKELNRSCSGWL